jgi:hypothetical protein
MENTTLTLRTCSQRLGAPFKPRFGLSGIRRLGTYNLSAASQFPMEAPPSPFVIPTGRDLQFHSIANKGSGNAKEFRPWRCVTYCRLLRISLPPLCAIT